MALSSGGERGIQIQEDVPARGSAGALWDFSAALRAGVRRKLFNVAGQSKTRGRKTGEGMGIQWKEKETLVLERQWEGAGVY